MVKEKKEFIYVIPLKRIYWGRRSNRAARAVRYVRRFVARHFGVNPEEIIVHPSVNKYLWSRGIEKPPRRIVVKVYRDKETGNLKVRLLERPEKVLAKKKAEQ